MTLRMTVNLQKKRLSEEMIMKQLKGIIFDFNGTLFFDTEQHEQAWKEYVRQLCGRDITDDEFRYCIHGRTNADILKYFLHNGLTDREIERHSEAKEDIYRRLCMKMGDQLHLADGAYELLDMLKAAGVHMSVATSSGRTNTQFYIKRFDLWRWFNQNTFIYSDGTLPGKPEPDIYIAAAEAIGLEPSECVVFEDMPSGIESAVAAGAGSIIAVASSLGPEFLSSVGGVDEVITDFGNDDFRKRLIESVKG